MRCGNYLAIGILSLCVSGPLFPQVAKPPSLKDQLEAQYAPGTVLVVQKDGILGLAPMIIKTCAAKYQNGRLIPADASCSASIKDSSRVLSIGERVNPRGVQVNLALETISLDIVECDACNNGVSPPSYKARIEFQFARGYLEKGNVSEIEDTIGQLLSIPSPEEAQARTEAVPAEVLTNNDVVRMVKAKLGDTIIISTIKSSASNFDTSVNGMVKLKEAAVSDPVILAMRDAQAAANAPASDPGQNTAPDTQSDQASAPTTVPGQLSFAVRHKHSTFFSTQPGVETYCYGTLSVMPDGTVAYDCDRTDDPSGRCDHVSFAPGSLKQAKIGFAGVLHIESKKQGKFDFDGKRDDMKQALDKIALQVQK